MLLLCYCVFDVISFYDVIIAQQRAFHWFFTAFMQLSRRFYVTAYNSTLYTPVGSSSNTTSIHLKKYGCLCLHFQASTVRSETGLQGSFGSSCFFVRRRRRSFSAAPRRRPSSIDGESGPVRRGDCEPGRDRITDRHQRGLIQQTAAMWGTLLISLIRWDLNTDEFRPK